MLQPQTPHSMKLVFWGVLLLPVLATHSHYNSNVDQDELSVSNTKARVLDESNLENYDNQHINKRETFGAANGYSVNYNSVYISSGLNIAIQLSQGIRNSMRGTIETPATTKTFVIAYYVLEFNHSSPII